MDFVSKLVSILSNRHSPDDAQILWLECRRAMESGRGKAKSAWLLLTKPPPNGVHVVGGPALHRVLHTAALRGDVASADALVAEIVALGAATVSTYNVWTKACSAAGDMVRAREIMENDLVEAGFTSIVVTHSTIVNGYMRTQQPDQALEFVEQLVGTGRVIDHTTFLALKRDYLAPAMLHAVLELEASALTTSDPEGVLTVDDYWDPSLKLLTRTVDLHCLDAVSAKEAVCKELDRVLEEFADVSWVASPHDPSEFAPRTQAEHDRSRLARTVPREYLGNDDYVGTEVANDDGGVDDSN